MSAVAILTALSPVIEKLFGIIDGFFKDKGEAAKLKLEIQKSLDAFSHEEQMAIYEQFAKEFQPPTNWFDSFVNGMNRLVRPLVTYGVNGGFFYGVLVRGDDMAAYPPLYLALVLTVNAFWFGGRILERIVPSGLISVKQNNTDPVPVKQNQKYFTKTKVLYND